MEQSTDSLYYIYFYLLLIVAAFVTYFLIDTIITRKKRKRKTTIKQCFSRLIYKGAKVKYMELYNKDYHTSLYSNIHRIYLDPRGIKMVLLENGIRMKEKDLLKLNPNYKSYFKTTKSTKP